MVSESPSAVERTPPLGAPRHAVAARSSTVAAPPHALAAPADALAAPPLAAPRLAAPPLAAPPRLAARPWFELGLASAFASALGGCASVRATPGITLACALAAGAAWFAAAKRWRAGDARALGLAALLVVALLRAAHTPRPADAADGAAHAAPRHGWEGRWHALTPGGLRGWLEDGHALPPVRVECELPGLAEGEWIARLDAAAPERPAASSIAREVELGEPWSGTTDLRAIECVRLAAPAGPAASPWPDGVGSRARTWLVARAARLERDLPPGFARALLYGETSALAPALRDLFSRTGTLHLLAVSGTHLVLLCALLLDPLGWLARAWLPPRRGIELALGLARAALLFAYVPVALAQAPVSRSALALGLAGLAALLPLSPLAPAALRASRRRADIASLWGLALALECALDPLAAHRLPVQLSYLATLGLLLGCAPLRTLLLARASPLLEAARRSSSGIARPWWIESAALLVARGAATALAASLAAVLATLPIAWSAFREFAPLGVLATPLCTPLFGVLLVVLWAAVLLPGWVPVACYARPCDALLALLEWIDRAPWTPLALPPRPLALVALLVVAAFVLVRRAAHGGLGPRGRLAAWLLAAAGALVCAPHSGGSARTVEIEALDVGHGTCVALRVGTAAAVVFDAGSRERPGLQREALEPLLSSWEGMPLWVALSHSDLDHSAAMPWLAGHRAPRVWLGELPAAIDALLPGSTRRIDVERGFARIALGAGARAGLDAGVGAGFDTELVLARGSAGAGNEGSRTLLLRAREQWIMLCGDAEADGLAALLELPLPARVRLLLWPHHGSDTPLLARLLDRVAPQEVWFSAAREPPVAAELARRGIHWRSTHREGPLRLTLEAQAPAAPRTRRAW
jgi:competence protein ComEC